MNTPNFIPIHTLCTHYQLELSFFEELNEVGLIEIQVVEQSACIHQEKISQLEKVIHLHQDLHVNLEGIDVVFNLLNKLETTQEELTQLKNRLRRYEG